MKFLKLFIPSRPSKLPHVCTLQKQQQWMKKMRWNTKLECWYKQQTSHLFISFAYLMLCDNFTISFITRMKKNDGNFQENKKNASLMGFN